MPLRVYRQPDPSPPPVPGFEDAHRLWDPIHHRWTVRIVPGELFVTPHNESISTILGTGLSVCMRDPVLRIGGMNQFILPIQGNDAAGEAARDPRQAMQYGRSVMERLLREVLKLGANRDRLKAKMFGGGRHLHPGSDVSEITIAFARRFLREQGVPLVAEKLGDGYPRRLMYFPSSGMALMERLPNRLVAAVTKRETQYVQSLIQSSPAGTANPVN
jgi:chemotaxis protein CheD